jgi:hypothetical protein
MKRDEPFLPPPGRERTPSERALSWEKAADIFAAALEKPAAERRQWLAELVGIDEALRTEVASLLEASEKAGDFLNPGEIRFP